MMRFWIACVALILIGSIAIAEERQVELKRPTTLHFPMARSDSPPDHISFGKKWEGSVCGGPGRTIDNQPFYYVSMEFKEWVLDPRRRLVLSRSTVRSGYIGIRVGDIFPVQDTLYRVAELSDQGVNLELVTDAAFLKLYAAQPDSQCRSISGLGGVPSKPGQAASILIDDYKGPDFTMSSPRPRREGDLIRWPGLAGRMRLRRIVPPDLDHHILGWIELQIVLPEEVARLNLESPQDCSLAGNGDQIVIQRLSATECDERLKGGVQGAGLVHSFQDEKGEPKVTIRFFEFCDLPGELRGAYGFAYCETGDLIPLKGALYSIGPLGPEVTLTRVAQTGFEKITPSRRSSFLELNSTVHTHGVTLPLQNLARIGESEFVVIEHTPGGSGAPKTVTWRRYPIVEDPTRFPTEAKETVSEGDIVELFEPSGKVPVRVQRIVLPDPEKHIVGWVELSPVDPLVK